MSKETNIQQCKAIMDTLYSAVTNKTYIETSKKTSIRKATDEEIKELLKKEILK